MRVWELLAILDQASNLLPDTGDRRAPGTEDVYEIVGGRRVELVLTGWAVLGSRRRILDEGGKRLAERRIRVSTVDKREAPVVKRLALVDPATEWLGIDEQPELRLEDLRCCLEVPICHRKPSRETDLRVARLELGWPLMPLEEVLLRKCVIRHEGPVASCGW